MENSFQPDRQELSFRESDIRHMASGDCSSIG
jgi:hypothetical protein